jgi:hypothetical protein
MVLPFYRHPEERERRLVSAHFSRRAMSDQMRAHHPLETIRLSPANDRIGPNLAARSRFRERPKSVRQAVVGVHRGGAIANLNCSLR